MQQACKPGSVRGDLSLRFSKTKTLFTLIHLPPRVCHLSWPAVAGKLLRSTPRHRTSHPYNAGIHDLSTHQAYCLLYYDRSGKLLPHLFTLTPPKRGGYFLLRYSALTNSFPLGRMALCVARTFLSSTKDQRQTGLLQSCKDMFFFLNSKFLIHNS